MSGKRILKKQRQNNNKNNLLREKQLISRSGVEIKEKQDGLQSDRSSEVR